MLVAIFTVMPNATFYCHYAECHHAKCRSATGDSFKKLFLNFSTKNSKMFFFKTFMKSFCISWISPKKLSSLLFLFYSSSHGWALKNVICKYYARLNIPTWPGKKLERFFWAKINFSETALALCNPAQPNFS